MFECVLNRSESFENTKEVYENPCINWRQYEYGYKANYLLYISYNTGFINFQETIYLSILTTFSCYGGYFNHNQVISILFMAEKMPNNNF